MKESPATFEDLEAWRQARLITKNVYALTRQPLLDRDYGLTSQIQRASVSIMSNVAEGFERRHVQEKLQFYNIAKGSTAEVRSLSYVIEDNYPTLGGGARQLRLATNQVGKLVAGLARSTELRRQSRIGLIAGLILLVVGCFMA